MKPTRYTLIVSATLNFLTLSSPGVNITLSRELYAVSERDGFVEVCVSLEGETEVTVEASVFTIAGSAQAE